MKSAKNFKSGKKGFTLIEVMVAVGVIAVSLTAMIGLLAAIMNNVNMIAYQTKALAIVNSLESELKEKSFKYVYENMGDTAKPYIIYFWEEYQNPDDMDNSSLMTVSSETPGKTPQTPPSKDDLENSVGEVYRVMVGPFQAGLVGEYCSIKQSDLQYSLGGTLPADVEDYGLFYLPLTLKVFVDPRDDILDSGGDETKNAQRLVVSDMVIVKTR